MKWEMYIIVFVLVETTAQIHHYALYRRQHDSGCTGSIKTLHKATFGLYAVKESEMTLIDFQLGKWWIV